MKIQKADKGSFAGTKVQQSKNVEDFSVSQPIAKPFVVRSYLSLDALFEFFVLFIKPVNILVKALKH